jgi:hypothetical protein
MNRPETDSPAVPLVFSIVFPAALLLLGFAVTVAGVSGCRFVEEILHMNPIEVTEHSPGEGEACAAPPEEISIRFSSPMVPETCERAFSAFSESEGAAIHGRFMWEDETLLIFLPDTPLENTDRITVRIDETAEDFYGNSLTSPYRFSFSVRPPDTRLTVATTFPADGEDEVPAETEITVEFSIPVDEGSFVSAFSLYPVSPGYFSTGSEGKIHSFTPREPLLPGTLYTVRIERSCRGSEGGPKLASPLQFRFTTSGAPVQECTAAYLVPEEGGEIPLDPVPGLNGGIEKDSPFRFEFSNAVAPSLRGSLVRSTPPTGWEEIWSEEGLICTARPESFLEYGTTYEISVFEAEYRLYIDGIRSRPPEVVLLSCCVDESAGAPPVSVGLNDYLHFVTAESGFFDFHVRHAEGGSIDTASFFEAFSVRTTNGCVTLETTGFEIDPEVPPPLGPAGAPGVPPAEEGTTETVFRTRFHAVDHGLPGTVTLIIDEGLVDTYDNRLEEEYWMTVNH